jgi:hypothetical protein
VVATSVGESTSFMPKIEGVTAHVLIPEPIRSCLITLFFVVLVKTV